ncbi:uncharacterized protein LOC110924459 [Helianthus annuus]|uniref:uncharacterized protein LOC110924459 n=1 Tax=Helianthus annuus TaxID=4232 RepID=UPI000B903972|nr:uncharacterized protein LOC110924459 [Helianthus annuus]
MGFPPKWRNWVMGILFAGRGSVLVNGSPTGEFQYKRGLRHGDPLSPFLFIIAMEALHVMMENAKENNIFHGIKLPRNGPYLTRMLYADDSIFIGEWENDNVRNLKRILRIFYLISGLKLNSRKSHLYGVGTSQEDVKNMASFFNCKEGKFPFVYLGLKVGANMNRIVNWKEIIDLFNKRLSNWKAKNLSFAGRVILVKSVLDTWIGNDPLMVQYPNLYVLAAKKKAKIKELYKSMNGGIFWDWAWTRAPNTDVEKQEMDSLKVQLQQQKMSLVGDFGFGGIMNIKNLVSKIWATGKSTTFVWRAIDNKIPSAVALRDRGINLQEVTCKICGAGDESAEHILLRCNLAARVWEAVKDWTKTQSVNINGSIGELLQSILEGQRSRHRRKMLHAIAIQSMWILWKNRNEKVFTGKLRSAQMIIGDIKDTSFQLPRCEITMKI